MIDTKGEENEMIATPQTTRPRRCSEAELARAGVRLIDRTEIRLECRHCGRRWSPKLGRGGRMPKGYWRCPEGCNSSE